MKKDNMPEMEPEISSYQRERKDFWKKFIAVTSCIIFGTALLLFGVFLIDSGPVWSVWLGWVLFWVGAFVAYVFAFFVYTTWGYS